MAKRIIEFGLCALLVLTFLGACPASELRETPAVRAVKRAKAAVVNIHSEKTAPASDSLFSSGRSRKVNGMGTGSIIDERGYIVTNHHVIDGVDSLRVTLYDGSTYDARVISYDREHDLAVIKINPTRPLKVIPLGTSSDLMLAETVIAVGNAFGYEHTVTIGIVSSLSRNVEVNEKQSYKNLIQTDASINPGNSGGPLLNLDGEVVGINVAIRAGAQRIGFAIPIDEARRVIAKLLSIEQLSNTYHGLDVADRKAGSERKLLVETAKSNSPAAEAGFLPGDVVLKAGSVEVVDSADLERALLGRNPGDEIEVVVSRKDAVTKLKLKLGAYRRGGAPAESPPAVVRANNNEESLAEKTWQTLGLQLALVPEQQRHLLGSRYKGGMRVMKVRPQSPAALNGIRQGDILVGLHLWETTSDNDVSYVLNDPQLPSFNPLQFYIVRGQETLYGHMRLLLSGE